MKHFLANTLIFFFITFGCNKKSDFSNDNYEEVEKNSIKNNEHQLNQDFYNFIQSFTHLNLPCQIKYKDSNWFDFSNSENMKEIDRELVKKYLLGKNDKKLRQDDGGYRQFYYGYKIIFSNNNIGLIYYRTDEEYTGFCISMFNSNGDFLYDSFIAGSKGEYDIDTQVDAYIFEEYIEINKLFIINENLANEETIKLDTNKDNILNFKKISNIYVQYNEETDRFEKVK